MKYFLARLRSKWFPSPAERMSDLERRQTIESSPFDIVERPPAQGEGPSSIFFVIERASRDIEKGGLLSGNIVQELRASEGEKGRRFVEIWVLENLISRD